VKIAEVTLHLHSAFPAASTITTEDLFRPEEELQQMLEPFLGDDPVFGRMNQIDIADFFDPEKLSQARDRVEKNSAGLLQLTLSIFSS